MRAEEAGDHVDVALAREAPRGAQHPHLSLALEPIARLDLDGGDAFREQAIEAGQAHAHEIVLARSPRRLHGGDDAAARPRDVLVGGAGKAQFEFVRPVSGIDQVGVAIDQAGRDPAAVQATRLLASQPAGSSAIGPANAMRPAAVATAPRSTTPSPP